MDARLLDIKNIDLPLEFKHSSKSRRIKNHKKTLSSTLMNVLKILMSSEFSYWEIDTVIGKKAKEQAGLPAMTEHITCSKIILTTSVKSSYSVPEAMTKLIKKMENYFLQFLKALQVTMVLNSQS
ncbi:hypothetical protein SAMN04515650_12416 [Halanaerobium congolense]|nr:hypothetical protein [Halanaerobium congolense]SHN11351.1 hypothetical protein SAMN04515650_12416 [Halanaerobium congolense]